MARIGLLGERARGTSLLEAMIYLTVLAILGTPLAMVTVGVSRASAEGDLQSRLLERSRSLLDRLAAEVRGSIGERMRVSREGRRLELTLTGECDGRRPLPAAAVRYEIRLAPGEIANGLDDDGNGLADEGVLARGEGAVSAGSSGVGEILLASGLSLDGSTFAAVDGGLRVDLVLRGAAPGGGAREVRRSIMVFPRN